MGAFAALMLTVAGWVRIETGGSILATGVLQMIAGFLSGALFGYAGLSRGASQKRWVSVLYAADVAGGCIGSLTASLLLIPFFGTDQTAAWMAMLAVFAVFFV
jgi:hypothetical protein